MSDEEWRGPIAVGGVGGSGTRVVAAVLLELGWWLGPEVNPSLDNLWFDRLFKRPGWGADGDQREVAATAKAFADAMTSPVPLADPDRRLLQRALLKRLPGDVRRAGRHRPRRELEKGVRRVRAIARGGYYDPERHAGWGWKLPITHLHLETLVDALPDMRYIHVVRHGVDMAFSSNQNQVRDFGYLLPDDRRTLPSLPARSLAFWAMANQRTMDVGRRLGPRFLAVRYEDLCANPAIEIDRISALLGLELDAPTRERLAAIPRQSDSAGRHHGRDLTIFDPRDLAVVEAFGYSVDD